MQATTGTIYDEALHETLNGGMHSSSMLLESDSEDENDDDTDEQDGLDASNPRASVLGQMPHSEPAGRIRRPSLYGELFGTRPAKYSSSIVLDRCGADYLVGLSRLL